MQATATSSSTLPPARMGGWFLSALGLAQICSWGSLYYAFPQIAVAMEAEFGWVRSDIYGALTVGLLLSAAAAVPVGMAIDRGHGRNVMTGGSVLAGLLFFLWSQVDSLLWFYLVFAGIGFLQAAVLYSAAFAVIARHYDNTRTRDYITSLTLWGGFASTLFIPMIEFMLGYLDWRQVLVVLGGINIFICAGVYAFLPAGGYSTATRKAAPAAPARKPDAKWALVQPIFWALLICFALYSAIASSFRFHLYPLLIENGLGADDAVFILALLGPAQVAGRALMKIFQTRSVAHVGIFIASLFPLSFLAMALFPKSFPVLVIAGLAYGAAAGTMTIVKGVAVPEFLTKNSYGLINGMMNTPITMLKAFAPSIAAVAWGVTGSYSGLIYGLSGLSTIMMLSFISAAVISKRPRNTA